MHLVSPQLVFIINSFNRLSLLKLAMAALQQWAGTGAFEGRCAVVVFDAGSTDGSREWLQQQTANSALPLQLVYPGANDDTSFSAGLNRGVAVALKTFPSLQYLVFYETDNQILSAEPMSKAIWQLEHNGALGACGFTVQRADGTMAGVGMPFPRLLHFAVGKNIVHRFNLEQIPYRWRDNGDGTRFSEVDVVFTSPLVVKKQAWLASGGLDPAVFPFSDCDIDWARQMKARGWKMGVIDTGNVIHDNLATKSEWSRTRELQSHRSRLRYFKRYRGSALYLVWPVPLLIRHAVEYAAASVLVRQPERRRQLQSQYLTLLKTCCRQYNP